MLGITGEGWQRPQHGSGEPPRVRGVLRAMGTGGWGVVGALGGYAEPPCAVPLLQCQLGVLPLGTGNDLARVLGWGSLCDDDTQLLQILEKLERATTKMLDR